MYYLDYCIQHKKRKKRRARSNQASRKSLRQPRVSSCLTLVASQLPVLQFEHISYTTSNSSECFMWSGRCCDCQLFSPIFSSETPNWSREKVTNKDKVKRKWCKKIDKTKVKGPQKRAKFRENSVKKKGRQYGKMA